MKHILLFFGVLCISASHSQLNILSTNTTAEAIMLGDFDPSDYASDVPITNHNDIIEGINTLINPDSLKAYLFEMNAFMNRNTGSDTVSAETGIGAARRWAFNKFESFSADSENRLVTSYLQFDQTICSMTQHRNIFTVLPGADAENHEVIIIEAHFDSRCDLACDIECEAQGMEDNGSGSALVLELARVMSKFTFENTIVFMLTIGEEQGLFGANAFSQYARDNDMPIKAVLNNDVIGGIICGETSSAPSCPGVNEIDSTQVRFFTSGGFNSPHKQLARFIKLQYKEELLPIVSVPMELTVMSAEDRTGRGGDHIPFRQDGFKAMRFTSAHEHGNAAVGPDYEDRQHTSEDVLGVDTDGDMVIDSFFVDFNYLARNAVINGVGAAMIATGPVATDFNVESVTDPGGIIIKINGEVEYETYRVGLRTASNDWDSVYTIAGTRDTIYPPTTTNYIVSVASVDENGVESLFSREIAFLDEELSVKDEIEKKQPFELMQNRPNPFDEATIIGVRMHKKVNYKTAFITVRDVNGKQIEQLPIKLTNEISEVLYTHGFGQVGTFVYTLVVDGVAVDSKQMIFAN